MKYSLNAAIIVASLAIWPNTADAKPKATSDGCSVAQVQSPAAAACLRQLEQDVMSGKPTIHALYCSSTGKIYCCEYSGNSIVDQSCSVVSGIKRAPSGGSRKNPGAVTQ